MEKQTVYLVSLGCPKNLVDSENLLGLLAERGAEIVEEPTRAEIIIVNTCAFIQSAVEEAVETILEMAEYKKTGAAETLAVFGCLPQRYKNDLIQQLPEVDIFWGSGDPDRMIDRLPGFGGQPPLPPDEWSKPGFASAAPGPRLRSAPFYRAYLKIGEGCGNVCSYCMIPKLRGPYRSRPMDVLISEAEALADSGVRELILVAQDTTVYGLDTKTATLAELLSELASIPGLDWIRVMYAYPNGISDELIRVMADEPAVLPYLDLPLQHAAPNVLKRMHRDPDIDLPALIDNLKRQIPGLSLRTTMMVGFPGETDDDFKILLDFVEQARFDNLGVFKFFPEDGVPASTYPDQVQQKIKENRRRRLMAVQRRISASINKAKVGQSMPVLVEGVSPETELLLVGRTKGQAPEIDGVVYINKGVASAGEIRQVKITESHDYDLVGEIAGD